LPLRQREADNAVITAEIQAMFLEYRGLYGSPRIHQELRAADLRAKTCQASGPAAKPVPNRCWAGDITYIRTTAGWRCLAVSHREGCSAKWMDLFSRRVVGWSLGASMEASLVLEALNLALGQRQMEPEQLLIHTRSGQPVRSHRLPGTAGGPWHHFQHVRQGLLLG
jgi:transposase InsO family protein